MLEETSTTGQSALKAVEALRREGAEPVAVAVIVDRKTGAQAAVEAEGLQWLAAIDLDDLGLDRVARQNPTPRTLQYPATAASRGAALAETAEILDFPAGRCHTPAPAGVSMSKDSIP